MEGTFWMQNDIRGNNFLKSNYSYAFALSTNQTADKGAKITYLMNFSEEEIINNFFRWSYRTKL